MVQVVNNHSEFYYQMFKDIELIHKMAQFYNEIWDNKYDIYKNKLDMLEKCRDKCLSKCWRCERVYVYNTFLTAITNCKIKMNRYSQVN